MLWGDFMTVASRIKEARTRKGITQKELGDILGVSQATVQQYESSKRNPPKLGTLRRIANALDVEVSSLLGDDAIRQVPFDAFDAPNADPLYKQAAADVDRLYKVMWKLTPGNFSAFVRIIEGFSYSDLLKLLRAAEHIKFDKENPIGQKQAKGEE